MGQKLNGRKKSTMLSDTLIGAASLKTLLGKPSGKKTIDKGKRVHRVSSPPLDHFS